ncbi:AAA family ATPase [Treponema zuelzerae]|uniref:AAA family ATPase n=1 Tax=Teretinema zuelzerae TaxID=156 RepID=A0AAE3JJ72_9SPIR|nr:UvrD-helicase domain-containing protein [Teretinema zuelzerae]MCD1655183.1 AAA family ATPase [Teretinema zuelzerae]
MSELAKTLADCRTNGYVIAPAGYGKTHLIAMAVKLAKERQLVLTHTYAGVYSLRNKMAMLNVDHSLYEIDTIASWSLRFCLAYPKSSQWDILNPSSSTEWNKLYDSTEYLLRKIFIQQIIQESYNGVYVDEYQDCSKQQHSVLLFLANLLPCRVLGDPLQGIFSFADESVDWESDIYPNFRCLGKLDKPWRWENAHSTEFAEWLITARKNLEAHRKIDLSRGLPPQVKVMPISMSSYSDPQKNRLFYGALQKTGSYIVIYSGDQRSKNSGHNLARSLGGVFSSIEEVECNELKKIFQKLDTTISNQAKVLQIIDFSKKCFTGIDKVLAAGTIRGEIATITKKSKSPELTQYVNNFINSSCSTTLRDFFKLLKNTPDCKVYRRDLFNRFMCVLDLMSAKSIRTFVEANESYQAIFRRSGRPLKFPRLIGTTLLVKGLEYDHAIYIDTGIADEKNLYVALTRASKSLTIITTKTAIP